MKGWVQSEPSIFLTFLGNILGTNSYKNKSELRSSLKPYHSYLTSPVTQLLSCDLQHILQC